MSVCESLEEGVTVTAKIIELGLAKPAPDAPAETAISTPGAFAGTPDFASPEQFAGVQLCYHTVAGSPSTRRCQVTRRVDNHPWPSYGSSHQSRARAWAC